FVAAATYTYCAVRILAEILGLDDYRMLVPPLTALWALLSMQMYGDTFELFRFFKPNVVLPYVALLLMLPFAVLWAAHLIRAYMSRARGKAGSGGA
ncbi:MAG: hypothetical protein NUW23_10890, partial [Firmicutes bacterium]|nr:hypothetical protein [Bacillota bacterium]